MFLSLQVYIVMVIGRTLSMLSILFKKGSGTSLPGLIVERWNPEVIRFFNNKYSKVIYISGTNGKTTTRSILVDLLEKNDIKVCSNRGGANILRGLASALISDLSWNLKIKSQYLVLEVEEATLPKISKLISVDNLILTNVFRDQLDAYGEIDTTLKYFVEFLNNQNCNVILNGDDPKLLEITSKITNPKQFIKIDSEDTPKYEGSVSIPVISDYSINNVSYEKGFMTFDYIDKSRPVVTKYTTQLSGVYNLYNILFALVMAENLKLKNIIDIIRKFEPVFGRGERFEINGATTILYLVKNPEGFNQVLQFIIKSFKNQNLTLNFLVNDNIADSRDVSWLWDVEFEKYRQKFVESNIQLNNVFVGGSRGDDILLRLETANFHVLDTGNNLGSISNVVDNIVQNSSDNIVFSTYTAMLEFRNELSKFQKVSSITQKGS
jgi:lipid II isoglutaminyl synthase (glutamine-hydrolysing)